MKTNNWINLDHHEYVALDLDDGRRLELRKGDTLILSVDYATIKQKDGCDVMIPSIKIAQIIKKLKARYL